MSGYFLWTDAHGELERTEVGEQPLTIGSQAPCGVVVEGDVIGPVHAAIERENTGCRLRRLTRVRSLAVNGRDVEELRLSHGDSIEFGDWKGHFVSSSQVAARMLRLVMTRDDNEIQVEVPVAGAITVIGRLEGDVLIDDGGVSSRHLEIENFGTGIRYVRDLGSTNGTELNGKPLGLSREPLNDGDILTIGRVRIEVRDGGATPDYVHSVVQRSVVFVTAGFDA